MFDAHRKNDLRGDERREKKDEKYQPNDDDSTEWFKSTKNDDGGIIRLIYITPHVVFASVRVLWWTSSENASTLKIVIKLIWMHEKRKIGRVCCGELGIFQLHSCLGLMWMHFAH